MKEKNMKASFSFQKKFQRLFSITLVVVLILLFTTFFLDNNINYYLISLSIFIVIISLLYFAYISLKFKQTINRNQYFAYILGISIGLPYIKNFLSKIIIGILLILYGHYKINLNSKQGQEKFAKRVAYLSIVVALYLFIILIKFIMTEF